MPPAPESPKTIRAGRREYDPELTPLARALLDSHEDHNDRVIEKIDEGNRGRAEQSAQLVQGMQRLANSQRITAAATTGGLFALLAFVIAGLMLLQGVDPKRAAEAARVVVEAVAEPPALAPGPAAGDVDMSTDPVPALAAPGGVQGPERAPSIPPPAEVDAPELPPTGLLHGGPNP